MHAFQWLPRSILVVTSVATHVNGHQSQQPVDRVSLHEQFPFLAHQQQPPLAAPLASLSPPPHVIGSEIDVDHSDYDPLFALHRDLVNINSISGHEHAIGLYLEAYLQSLNYTVERQVVAPPLIHSDSSSSTNTHSQQQQQQEEHEREPLPRFNLLAHPPSHRNTPIILTTHIDTVPPFYPFSTTDPPTNHQLFGRGSVDAKACIATQLFAARSLLARSLLARSLVSPDAISHLFVVGEEIGGDGMIAANALDLTPRAVIFGEPTELHLASGHKGILIFRLHAHGKAAHSGYPWLGASATGALVRALAALERMPLPWSEKYGNSTLNIGKVTGGVAANVVAENATAEVGVRLAGGSVEDVKRLIKDTVFSSSSTHPPDDYNGGDSQSQAKLTLTFYGGAYPPVSLDTDIPSFRNNTTTVNYGTDVPNLHFSGDLNHHPRRYLYGPGSIQVAHSDHEGLSKREMVEAVAGYERIILHCMNIEDGKEEGDGEGSRMKET